MYAYVTQKERGAGTTQGDLTASTLTWIHVVKLGKDEEDKNVKSHFIKSQNFTEVLIGSHSIT